MKTTIIVLTVLASSALAGATALAALRCDDDSRTQQGDTRALVSPALLKLLLEHPALEPYLRRGAAGRSPLVVSDRLVEPGLAPSRFGQPIVIVGDAELRGRACLRVAAFDRSGSRATATVEVRPERSRVVFRLETAGGWWRVVGAQEAAGSKRSASR